MVENVGLHVSIEVGKEGLSVAFESETLQSHFGVHFKDARIASGLEKLDLRVASSAFIGVVGDDEVQKLSLLFGDADRGDVGLVVVWVHFDWHRAQVLLLVRWEVVALE